MEPENLLTIDENYAFESSTDDDDDRETYSSTRTLASTVNNYVYENGRRYHAYRQGKWYMPNDEKYNSSEVVLHHLWLLTLDDKLFLAPLDNPQRILDLGTGTGLWAIDMADRFPGAEVIGTDLSPTQNSITPPNVTFEVDDFSDEWTYPADSFDYIHLRSLMGAVADWKPLYRQALKHLRAGGYIEQCEFSPIIASAAGEEIPELIQNVLRDWRQAGLNMGRRLDLSEELADMLDEEGFVDVVDRVFAWPFGQWPKDPRMKEVGRWQMRNFDEGLESWLTALFTRNLGWSLEKVQETVRDFKRAIKDRKLHLYQEVHVLYARRPA